MDSLGMCCCWLLRLDLVCDAAEQVGIPLGTTCLDVFAHTNTVRASYKGLKPYDTDGTEWDKFAEQYVVASSMRSPLASH